MVYNYNQLVHNNSLMEIKLQFFDTNYSLKKPEQSPITIPLNVVLIDILHVFIS